MKLAQLTPLELSHILHSDLRVGLTTTQAALNRAQYGANSFPRSPRDTYFTIFISQFKNPLIYLLLLAALIIFFTGAHLDAFIISGVLLFNAILGTIQEGRTAQIIEQLEGLIKNEVLVIRDGQRQIITDRELVVGDLVILQEGARIPADLSLVSAQGLLVDEAVLTGESRPVNKIVTPVPLPAKLTHGLTHTPITATAGIKNSPSQHLLFQGTYITSGAGQALVIAVGAQTQLGQLNKLVSTVEKDLPLQQDLARLSYWIIIFILMVCGGLLVIGLLTGKPFAELLAMLTALFICVVPEGLPVVLTLVLVTGVYRMARRQVLVKKLRAVEMLGRIDVVLTDKTGTLTRNEMMVQACWADGQLYQVTGQGYFPTGAVLASQEPITQVAPASHLYQAGLAAALLGDVELEFIPQQHSFNLKGDPTEAALQIFAQKLQLNVSELRATYLLQTRLPFNVERRLQAGLYQVAQTDQKLILALGAPETILAKCQLAPGPLAKTYQELASLVEQGLRVVAVAQKIGGQFGDLADELKQLEFVALFGIQDTVRQDAPSSVAAAQAAGLDVIMLTGDHPDTALFVAKQVGIINQTGRNLVVTGAEFANLNLVQKQQLLNQVAVFARVSPQLKFEIVQLYQAQKKLVAVTGDGVNDAPALALADVGIAMGGVGTEIAKQAAELILLEDSFAGLVYAIKQGRHIFYSLKRVILYFFATNLGEVLVVLGALVLNLPVPILPAQILWLNLVTDGFLDMALAMEPEEQRTLTELWSTQDKQLLTRPMALKIWYMAILMGLGSLWIFRYYYDHNLAYARTMTLLTMAMFQWFNAWNCRSDYQSVFKLGLFSNRWLLLATAVVLGLQVAVVYTPLLQAIFKTVPITGLDWLIVLGVSLTVFLAEELRKWWAQRV